jgi:hypothetical protein
MLLNYKTLFGSGYSYTLKFNLPLKDTVLFYNNYMETITTGKNLTLTLPAASYSGCMYVRQYQYNPATGVSGIGGLSALSIYYFKPTIGIIYMNQGPIARSGPSGACCTASFSTFYVRRLIDYNIK